MSTIDEPQVPEVKDGGERRTRPAPSHAPLTPDLELREIRQGAKPGSRYVRLAPKSQRPFEAIDTGELRATAVAMRPRTQAEAVWRGFKRIVVGAPLSSARLMEERLPKIKALAVFASDNLSSSAYATEEILLVLLLASTAVFVWSIPISIAICALVALVAMSYTQVIRGYPTGGGSYAVAKANLGIVPGVVAGSSLVVDYMLTVAVSTAAGIAAVVSAFPELHDYRIYLAIGSVSILTLGNLRGLRESGTLFAVPAYIFILSISALIVTGFVRMLLGHEMAADLHGEALTEGTQTLSIFLILRAFSSGSAALTGIEAISNGVTTFKPPEARNANITLVLMAAILAFFFFGLTVLAHETGARPSHETTVIAQVADGVFANEALFYLVQGATTLILLLAANTSFAGLPALGSVMARDRFLPKQFAFRGDRLAYSHGIVFLGVASVLLLVAFEADTHRLIPLYAVGVFVGFTLSQAGMVLHWRTDPSPGARVSRTINLVGAIATGFVMVIIAATKFVDGAWITIASIAVLTVVFLQIHRHYSAVAKQLDVSGPLAEMPTILQPADQNRERAVIMPIDELNQAVMHTLEFARTVSDNVTAVHITDEVEEGERLRAEWEEKVPETPIVIIESPYRSFLAPMLAYIDGIDRVDPGAYITVVLPEFVPAHFWEGLLHNQSASRLKRALIHRPNTVLINVPYHLR
jgi:amino acid transporter